MKTAIYYHAGCPVCVSAEQEVLSALDKSRYQVQLIDLSQDKASIVLAEQAGVVSVPALLLDGRVFHINFGASLADVKG
jgi:glutaredoxin 3